MNRFVGRQRELAELDRLLAAGGSQMVLVYGRRRVGKTTLLLHWATSAGRPVVYWMASRDKPENLRYDMAQAVRAALTPDLEGSEAPRYPTWAGAFEDISRLIGDRPVIFIMDEFPYAADADKSLASHVQRAWDHLFKPRQVFLALAGSHISAMVELREHHAPLYGRFTAQMPLDPLPFSALGEFVSRYDLAHRVAVYAVLGGIPAYLEQWDDSASLDANLQHLFMRRTSMFRDEPTVLISDLIRRETDNYELIIKAIAAGRHTRTEIASATVIPSGHLSPYLNRLQSLHLIERRIPATVPPEKRERSKLSRYHLRDSYLRFWYRFIRPNLYLVEQELVERLWNKIRANFRAFVAETFEALAREWTLVQARAGRLPVDPDVVGSHWSRDVQVDVVAVAWDEKEILLGEAKWGAGQVSRGVVRELIERKTPRILQTLPAGGDGWKVHYAFFAREGYTEAAAVEARQHGMLLLTLETMAAGLD